MRRSMIAVVAVVVVFAAGVSFAQENNPMPEKVRKFLEYRVGTWNIEGEPVTGTLECEWDSEKNHIIGNAQLIINDVPISETSLWCWDKTSENKIIGYSMSSNRHAVSHAKVMSDTLVDCETTGVMSSGKNISRKMRYELNSSDRHTISFTNWVVGGERQSDWTGILTKVKPTTREDFQEYCKLHEGRWVSDITWATDWPGFGKKGETVTAYMQGTLSEDGNALITKFNGGKGSWTELFVYDADAKQINSTWATSGGSMGHSIVNKSNGKWIGENIEIHADGTKSKFTLTATFSDNGNKLTIKGGGTTGDEKLDIPGDVWHRLNK